MGPVLFTQPWLVSKTNIRISVLTNKERSAICFFVFLFFFRHNRYLDECCGTSCLLDPATQTGASPPTSEQEWHQTCAWPRPLLPQNHQETSAQRSEQWNQHKLNGLTNITQSVEPTWFCRASMRIPLNNKMVGLKNIFNGKHARLI